MKNSKTGYMTYAQMPIGVFAKAVCPVCRTPKHKGSCS